MQCEIFLFASLRNRSSFRRVNRRTRRTRENPPGEVGKIRKAVNEGVKGGNRSSFSAPFGRGRLRLSRESASSIRFSVAVVSDCLSGGKRFRHESRFLPDSGRVELSASFPVGCEEEVET